MLVILWSNATDCWKQIKNPRLRS